MASLRPEFERLLTYVMDNAKLLRKARLGGNIQIYGDIYSDGVNFYHRGRNSAHMYSKKDFLMYKYTKEELYDAVNNLKDYENVINLVQGKAKPNVIVNIRNTTIRRNALQFVGVENFFNYMNAKSIDTVGKEQLLSLRWHDDEEPMVFVKVVCPSTAEVYLLRVPPTCRTVQEAKAWTFGLDADDYRPLKET